MSSKKARRRRRQEQTEDRSKRRVNPATLFILGIGLALVLTVVGGLMLGNRRDRGEPPSPGMVWSAQHGHWH